MVNILRAIKIYPLLSVSRDQKVKAGTVLGKSGTSIDGEGGILFMIMNDKSVAQNPTPWLRSK
jgi:septal ring factor EnvC (AmiA/AmiB activator)